MKRHIIANIVKYTVGLPLLIGVSLYLIVPFAVLRAFEFLFCATICGFDEYYPIINFTSNLEVSLELWRPHKK